ncbi:unnamed protein product [Protopolystoma xenopodis]|uniref:Uncharacterized protein n=1 Tax=Protopolystoma xenopodis TaxID=117903 RepID=A0A448XHL8_9PLAT|nr:unnamed protein product [Protopolystoma xenopodis]
MGSPSGDPPSKVDVWERRYDPKVTLGGVTYISRRCTDRHICTAIGLECPSPNRPVGISALGKHWLLVHSSLDPNGDNYKDRLHTSGLVGRVLWPFYHIHMIFRVGCYLVALFSHACLASLVSDTDYDTASLDSTSLQYTVSIGLTNSTAPLLVVTADVHITTLDSDTTGRLPRQPTVLDRYRGQLMHIRFEPRPAGEPIHCLAVRGADGLVDRLFVEPSSRTDGAGVNLLKGLVSLVNFNAGFESGLEVDASGECQVFYALVAGGAADRTADGGISVDKEKLKCRQLSEHPDAVRHGLSTLMRIRDTQAHGVRLHFDAQSGRLDSVKSIEKRWFGWNLDPGEGASAEIAIVAEQTLSRKRHQQQEARVDLVKEIEATRKVEQGLPRLNLVIIWQTGQHGIGWLAVHVDWLRPCRQKTR